MKVLSFHADPNVFGFIDSCRLSEQIKQIKRLDCDVICLQGAYTKHTIDIYMEAFLETHQMFSEKKGSLFTYYNPSGLAILIRRQFAPLCHLLHHYKACSSQQGAMVCSVRYRSDSIFILNTHISSYSDGYRDNKLAEILPDLVYDCPYLVVCGSFGTGTRLPVFDEYRFTDIQAPRMCTTTSVTPFDTQSDRILVSSELWKDMEDMIWNTELKQEPCVSSHLGVMLTMY